LDGELREVVNSRLPFAGWSAIFPDSSFPKQPCPGGGVVRTVDGIGLRFKSADTT
jgi:hypothetical protein